MITDLVREKPAKTSSSRVFRADIQALRALAVTLVVLNHLWPVRLTGGYVGVDVFFVISGFLITGHLVKEITRTGGVQLGAFYARRVRRLLPAAFLVLVVSLVGVVLLLPYSQWERNAWEVAASAGYVENWLLSALAVDYSAANESASAVQHFWSLSVEEQFYILWPLLLLAGAALAVRVRALKTAPVLLAIVAATGVLSLAASVLFTAAEPQQAYFATFTRAWEFAIGGIIALIGARLPLSRALAQIFSIVGFIAIVGSAIAFTADTPFPGFAALIPVLGTALVIFSGMPGYTLAHSIVTSRRPIQWLGGASYSIYLWHWPLIVLTPFALNDELSTLTKLLIIAVTLVLASLTKRFVEDRVMHLPAWQAPKRALLTMVAGLVAILLACGAVLAMYALRAQQDAPPAVVAAEPCIGPSALAPGAECDDVFGPPEYTAMVAKNEYFAAPDECGDFLDILSFGGKMTTTKCDFSQGAADAHTVWLVGDSHAQQWQGALFDIAKEQGWVLTTSYMGGCPVADVAFIGFREPWGEEDVVSCRDWSAALNEELIFAQPDLIVTAMAARQHLLEAASAATTEQQMIEGLTAYWKGWQQNGSRVLAIADPPYNVEVRSPDCVTVNDANPRECARTRSDAQPADPIVAAAADLGSDAVVALDMTDRFCDPQLCYAVVGGVPVYYDADHLNLEYVRMLRPLIQAQTDHLLSMP